MRGCRLSALLLSPFALLRERDMDKESEEGMTYQQIADELGYKDRSSIGKILKRNS